MSRYDYQFICHDAKGEGGGGPVLNIIMTLIKKMSPYVMCPEVACNNQCAIQKKYLDRKWIKLSIKNNYNDYSYNITGIYSL